MGKNRQIILCMVLCGLLLNHEGGSIVSAGSRRTSQKNDSWQPLKRNNGVRPSIMSVGPPMGGVTMYPTVRPPAGGAVGMRRPSRSLDWIDMGNGARIRVGEPINPEKVIVESLKLPPAEPLRPLFQLTPSQSQPAPITGARSQSPVDPASASPQAARQQSDGQGEISLGGNLRLPPNMNITLRSVDFRETELSDALRSLASLINLNLMLSAGIEGTVTILFSEVTIEEALNTLLRSFDLAFQWEGNILRVFPMANAPLKTTIFNIQNTNAVQVKEIIDRLLTQGRGTSDVDSRTNSIMVKDTQMVLDSIRQLLPKIDVKESLVDVASRPLTEVFYLNYVDANNLNDPIQMIAPAAQIQAYSSSQASQAGAATAAAGGRMDMMIITDTQANLERIRELIEKLDIAPIQITIDAHIYEIDLNEEERLGINWQKQIPIPGTEDNIFDMTIAPESATAGGTGVFRFGSLDVNQFRAILSMLRNKSFARVLSNPVITTLNNRQANITVGQAIPYVSGSVTDQAGNVRHTIAQVNADITLNVTPSVTGNDEVFLDIQPTISSVLGFSTLGGNPTPNISNRSAQTQVIIKNNHTIVIGGMIKTDRSETKAKVPFLGSLPGIGKFFQRKTSRETRTELIIFITPHIVRQPGARSRLAAGETTQAVGMPRLQIQP